MNEPHGRAAIAQSILRNPTSLIHRSGRWVSEQLGPPTRSVAELMAMVARPCLMGDGEHLDFELPTDLTGYEVSDLLEAIDRTEGYSWVVRIDGRSVQAFRQYEERPTKALHDVPTRLGS